MAYFVLPPLSMLHDPTRHERNRDGHRFLDYVKKQGLYHPGHDYNFGIGAADRYQEVVSPTWGTVIYVSGPGHNGGLGTYVVVHHPHNNATTRYMHLDSTKVHAGETVYPKQILGYLGHTGNAVGDHLHFEVLTPAGVDFINKGIRPYGRYTKGLTKKQVASYWIDPLNWLKTEEHYVGPDNQKKLNQATNALKWAVPPRRNMIERLVERLSRLTPT